MDKFLIDPPISIESKSVPHEEFKNEFGPPDSPISESVEEITRESILVPHEEFYSETGPPDTSILEPIEEITRESILVPHEEFYSETGPPEQVVKSIIEPQIETIEQPQIETIELQMEPIEPIIKFSEIISPEPIQRSWFSFLWWTFVLLIFIIISIYYAFKMYVNKSNYIIKINIDEFKLSLDVMREDIQEWLLSWRDWNEDMYDKINQFFFRQHVKNGTFKVKKYRIPKNIIATTENPKK